MHKKSSHDHLHSFQRCGTMSNVPSVNYKIYLTSKVHKTCTKCMHKYIITHNLPHVLHKTLPNPTLLNTF